MSNAHEMDVPVTREGALVALKLVMIVLAAAMFWQAALAVNTQFQARCLVTAPPFLRSAAELLAGAGDAAPFRARLSEFMALNHRLVALGVMMIAAGALVIRYIALGRLLDYLYVESPAEERRAYTGFLANIMLMLLHAGALYGVVSLGSGDHAGIVPVALLAMLFFNFVWFLSILVGARLRERRALRGVGYLAGTALTAGVVLFCAAWVVEARSAAAAEMKGSQLMLVAAAVAMLLCLADGYVQGRVYVTRPRPAAAGA